MLLGLRRRDRLCPGLIASENLTNRHNNQRVHKNRKGPIYRPI